MPSFCTGFKHRDITMTMENRTSSAVKMTVELFLLLDGRGLHPLAQAPLDLSRLEGTATRVGLVQGLMLRSRLTSHWRRPDPPAPGPRGLRPMPSPYGPNYPNWLPRGVTQGPRWPGRTTGGQYIIHRYAHRNPTPGDTQDSHVGLLIGRE